MKMGIVIFLIFTGIIGFLGYRKGQLNSIDRIYQLEAELSQLKIDKQYDENMVYRDCQVLLRNNAIIQRANGCYRGMEILCYNKAPKNEEFCMKELTPVCNHLEAED